jgi:hypothetical protein
VFAVYIDLGYFLKGGVQYYYLALAPQYFTTIMGRSTTKYVIDVCMCRCIYVITNLLFTVYESTVAMTTTTLFFQVNQHLSYAQEAPPSPSLAVACCRLLSSSSSSG